MRERRMSGGQDFGIVCACFVVVAFACVKALAQDAIVFKDTPVVAARIPAIVIVPENAPARIESAKQPALASRFRGDRRPVRLPRGVDDRPHLVMDQIVKFDKKAAGGLEERRSKIKQENIARDEIKKSAEDVRQETRLIALDGQGISYEQRRSIKDTAAEWRRQLRFQLNGNVVRQQQVDDGIEEAKRAAREQARKVAEEARIQALRE